jgi:hypothetical protein
LFTSTHISQHSRQVGQSNLKRNEQWLRGGCLLH